MIFFIFIISIIEVEKQGVYFLIQLELQNGIKFHFI